MRKGQTKGRKKYVSAHPQPRCIQLLPWLVPEPDWSLVRDTCHKGPSDNQDCAEECHNGPVNLSQKVRTLFRDRNVHWGRGKPRNTAEHTAAAQVGNCHTIQGPAPKRVQQFLRLIIFNDGERNAVLRTVAFETFAILTPLNNAYLMPWKASKSS